MLTSVFSRETYNFFFSNYLIFQKFYEIILYFFHALLRTFKC